MKRLPVLLFGCAVLIIPFAANYNFIINLFYLFGAPFWDAGWLSAVVWRSGILLTNPRAWGVDGSFHAVHLCPFLSLAALLSSLIPAPRIDYFAAFMGSIYAFSGFAVYCSFITAFQFRSAAGCSAAAVIALLYAFNGITLGAAGYPHYELAIPAFLSLFLVFYSRKQWVPALLFYCLCLSVRPDSGFHIVSILGLLLAFRLFTERRLRKEEHLILLTAAAFACSAAAFALQARYFPGVSTLEKTYLGNPPLSHVTLDRVAGLVPFFLDTRQNILLPFAVTLVWAAASKNPLLLLGWAAALPWLLISAFAVSQGASHLWGYYAFPFISSLFFPLIACALNEETECRGRRGMVNAAWFSSTVLASLIGWRGCADCPKVDFRPLVPRHVKSMVNQFADDLMDSRTELGRVLADQAVLSINPQAFEREEHLAARAAADIDSVVYHSRGLAKGFGQQSVRWAAANAARNGLCRNYRIAGTDFYITTSRSLDNLPSFRPYLTEQSALLGSLLPARAAKTEGGWRVERGEQSGIVLYGPYLPLASGQYRALYVLEFHDRIPEREPVIGIDAAHDGGRKPLLPPVFFSTAQLKKLPSGYAAEASFTVGQGEEITDAEVRLWATGHTALTVRDFRLMTEECAKSP